MKWPTLAIGCLFLGAPIGGHAKPTVVELFTSQGCSSCPPAEQFIGELSNRSDVLALSFHVDYWDDLGWKDPFSSSEATTRQGIYAKVLGLPSVYTPQVVIDGIRQYVGSNRAAIEPLLLRTPDDVPVRLAINQKDVIVDVGETKTGGAADVLLVAYLKNAATRIDRGENSGRTILQSNVVRAFRQLGRWQGVPQRWTIRLDSIPTDATDLAIVVQRIRQGAIVGAAKIAVR